MSRMGKSRRNYEITYSDGQTVVIPRETMNITEVIQKARREAGDRDYRIRVSAVLDEETPLVVGC